MKKIRKIFILIILLIQLLSVTNFADTEVKSETNNNTIVNDLELDCEAAILLEEKSGIIVYEKNSNEKLYPASTTKILTAILVLENCNLSDSITVTESSQDSIPSRLCYWRFACWRRIYYRKYALYSYVKIC